MSAASDPLIIISGTFLERKIDERAVKAHLTSGIFLVWRGLGP